MRKAFTLPRPLRLTGRLGKLLRALRPAFGKGYRPELHYMRGPGPATRRRARPSS